MPRLNTEIVAEITQEIVQGTIAPGQMLPREVDLAHRYTVSRGVVRECVRALEERGLASVTHGRGARVTSPSEWNALDPVVLAALVASGVGEPREEALECLRLLEGEAAGLAAECASAAQVAAIASTLESGAADGAFSEKVAIASGNTILARLIRSLQRALAIETGALGPHRGLPGGLSGHARVLAAIAGGDRDAARAAMSARLATAAAGAPRGADLVATP